MIKNNSNIKVLVTGAAGFVGFHLSKLLLEKGIEVFGVDSINGYYSTQIKNDRIKELESYNNFSFSSLNICNRNDLDVLFASNNFSLVIHLAAQAGVRYSIDAPLKYAESNLIGFMNILEVSRQNKIKKIIYASSSSVYGDREEGQFVEDSNTDLPESIYAATKKANEVIAHSYAKQFDIQLIGLRFFSVYGPWGRPDMAYFSFTKKILNDEVIPVFNNGEMARDFTYVDDITEGVYKLINNLESLPQYKIYNLGNNHPIKILDLIKILEDNIGKQAKINYLPMQAGDVVYTCADFSSAQKDFDYQPKTDINRGIKNFVSWYKEYYNI